MHSLAEHQHILGIDVDEEKSLFLRAVKGDFLRTVRHPSLPFHEKLYYLLIIFWYIQFDWDTTLALMETALHKKIMPYHYKGIWNSP